MMTDFKKVFIDTALFIYLIEKHIEFGEISKNFFNFCGNNDKIIFTSTITHLEFSVKPYRENKLDLIDTFRKMISETGILISDVLQNDCDLAAQLRAKYISLKNFDALQIAIAIKENCDIFMCNDKKIKIISEIPIYTLDNLNLV
jgi:predicted nucleic acid-binding protein